MVCFLGQRPPSQFMVMDNAMPRKRTREIGAQHRHPSLPSAAKPALAFLAFSALTTMHCSYQPQCASHARSSRAHPLPTASPSSLIRSTSSTAAASHAVRRQPAERVHSSAGIERTIVAHGRRGRRRPACLHRRSNRWSKPSAELWRGSPETGLRATSRAWTERPVAGRDGERTFPKFPKPMPSRPPRPGCFFCAAGGCGLLLPPNIANGSYGTKSPSALAIFSLCTRPSHNSARTAFFCGAPPCFCDDCAMPTRSSANGSMGSGDGCDGAAPTSSLKDRSFSPLPELKVAKSCALDAELSSSMPSMSFPSTWPRPSSSHVTPRGGGEAGSLTN
eukprot:scaffold305_cov247-Pinguiococcus_pyrenoidosus.AAC.15